LCIVKALQNVQLDFQKRGVLVSLSIATALALFVDVLDFCNQFVHLKALALLVELLQYCAFTLALCLLLLLYFGVNPLARFSQKAPCAFIFWVQIVKGVRVPICHFPYTLSIAVRIVS
jgi:hypothetical protein